MFQVEFKEIDDEGRIIQQRTVGEVESDAQTLGLCSQ